MFFIKPINKPFPATDGKLNNSTSFFGSCEDQVFTSALDGKDCKGGYVVTYQECTSPCAAGDGQLCQVPLPEVEEDCGDICSEYSVIVITYHNN